MPRTPADHVVRAAMEPAGRRRGETTTRHGCSRGRSAAMEPAGHRRDETDHGSVAVPLATPRPQWSPPVTGGMR